jgi:hypothetical protein
MNVALALASTRAAEPKKLKPEKTESSMETFVSRITIVAPGSSTALKYCTPVVREEH